MAHALTPPLAPARLDATQRSGDTDSRAHWALENNMADKSAPVNLPFADSFDLVKRVWGMTGLPTVPGPAAMAQFAQRLPQALRERQGERVRGEHDRQHERNTAPGKTCAARERKCHRTHRQISVKSSSEQRRGPLECRHVVPMSNEP